MASRQPRDGRTVALRMVEKLKGFGDILADAFGTFDFRHGPASPTDWVHRWHILMLKKAWEAEAFAVMARSLGGVNELIGGFTGKMEAMQSKLDAETLLAIAGAIADFGGGSLCSLHDRRRQDGQGDDGVGHWSRRAHGCHEVDDDRYGQDGNLAAARSLRPVLSVCAIAVLIAQRR